MSKIDELNRRVIELDAALDQVIIARGENLAAEIEFMHGDSHENGKKLAGGAALAGGAIYGGMAMKRAGGLKPKRMGRVMRYDAKRAGRSLGRGLKKIGGFFK